MMQRSLPNAERAIVPERKLVDYLLSEAHPDGRGKARFFMDLGFTPSVWPRLAEALRRHAIENRVVDAVETVFGTRYVVEGILHAPDRRTPQVRTVWFVGREDTAPRLVTAYPVRRR